MDKEWVQEMGRQGGEAPHKGQPDEEYVQLKQEDKGPGFATMDPGLVKEIARKGGKTPEKPNVDPNYVPKQDQ
uniref:Uncharacterized protein n=1 Tax=Panagrolaimus davidi TaxID=227884 RepID=A0A914P7V3_9BILA